MEASSCTHEESVGSQQDQDVTNDFALRSPDWKNNVHPQNISKQLLYSDKFSDCYREQKLSITGKNRDVAQTQGQTFRMQQSSVLSKLKDFLPHMLESNKSLVATVAEDQESADKINIEHIESTDASVIEMSLSVIPSELMGSEDSSSSESDSSSESESEDVLDYQETSNLESVKQNFRHVPKSVKRQKPCIQEVNSSDCDNSFMER